MRLRAGEHQRMPFGKFKGVPLAECPPDYLRWAVANLERIDRGLRASMERALEAAESVTEEEPVEPIQEDTQPSREHPTADRTGYVHKDNLLPLTTGWLGDLLGKATAVGEIPVQVAHETLLDALGLRKFNPNAGPPAAPAKGPEYLLRLRALQDEVPVEVRLRHVLKRLLRQYQFKAISVDFLGEGPT